MTKSLQIFKYKNNEVRTVEKDGEIWFVAKDVCDVLEHSNSRVATQALDDDEKDVRKVYTPSGEQDVTIISESGLYALILRSNKPEAKAFSRWVRHEVLPQIRKTGSYSLQEAEPLNVRVRVAEVLQRLALQVTSKAEREVINREAYKYATGQDLPKKEPTPKTQHTPRIWTAQQIAATLKWTTEAVIHRADNLGIGCWNGETLCFSKAERKKFLELVGQDIVRIEDGFAYYADGHKYIYWRFEAE